MQVGVGHVASRRHTTRAGVEMREGIDSLRASRRGGVLTVERGGSEHCTYCTLSCYGTVIPSGQKWQNRDNNAQKPPTPRIELGGPIGAHKGATD